MERRAFIRLAGSSVAMWSWGAMAQARPKIGILMPYSKSHVVVRGRVAALRDGLATLGRVDGKNVTIYERWTGDNLSKVKAAANELVSLGMNVILTTGSRVVPIVQRATSTIPIVFVGTSDPVGQGLVTSLARPGGNTTGFLHIEFTDGKSPLMGKLFELAKQIVPEMTRAALMFNPQNPATVFHVRTFQEVAPILRVKPSILKVRTAEDIEQAITKFAAEPGGIMLLPSDLTLLSHRKLIVDLVSRHHLPTVYSDESFVKYGGLISYSADRAALFRRSAGYIDRILKGAKPSNLPVQQPLTYLLSINLKTAKALGLSVTDSILVRADEVIE